MLVPWFLALTTSPNVLSVLRAAPTNELVYCFLCGAAWGFGGLTWGLMIRYLGIGLGLAMGAGLTSAAGTLIPPMLKGSAAITAMFTTPGGIVSVVSAVVSLVGIVFVGMAGRSKEGELSEEQKRKTVAEFNFRKGILVAIFSGLMSSAMSFGLQGGPSMQSGGVGDEPETSIIWAGMPVLVVVLLGGFVVNFIWCLFLECEEPNGKGLRRQEHPDPAEPDLCRYCRRDLVFAVYLLQNRRAPNGHHLLHRLGCSDGKPDPFQPAAGNDARRMERHREKDTAAAGDRASASDRLRGDCRHCRFSLRLIVLESWS